MKLKNDIDTDMASSISQEKHVAVIILLQGHSKEFHYIMGKTVYNGIN